MNRADTTIEVVCTMATTWRATTCNLESKLILCQWLESFTLVYAGNAGQRTKWAGSRVPGITCWNQEQQPHMHTYTCNAPASPMAANSLTPKQRPSRKVQRNSAGGSKRERLSTFTLFSFSYVRSSNQASYIDMCQSFGT